MTLRTFRERTSNLPDEMPMKVRIHDNLYVVTGFTTPGGGLYLLTANPSDTLENRAKTLFTTAMGRGAGWYTLRNYSYGKSAEAVVEGYLLYFTPQDVVDGLIYANEKPEVVSEEFAALAHKIVEIPDEEHVYVYRFADAMLQLGLFGEVRYEL